MPFIAGKGARKGKAGGKRQSRQTRRFVLPVQDRKIDWNLELSAPERRHFPDTGTTLYSVPNHPVAEWVLRNGRPLGFKSNAAFRHFTDRLQREIGKLDPKARIAMRGSSINGLSYDDVNKGLSRRFFDTKVDSASDFDIAIVSPELLNLARQKGITILPRNGGLRTGPLEDEGLLDMLGLWDLLQRLRSMSGKRRISFMIYESVEQLERRGTMMLLR